MCSIRPSPTSRGRRQLAGFTLIELMIGVAIGLLATLAVTHVLVNSEGNKRAATAGSDAQVNGALALATLQRDLQSAGYGFASVPAIVGCPLVAKFNGAAIAGFPANLVPVIITDGASDAPDTIRVLASGTPRFSVPMRVVTGYVPATSTTIGVNATTGVFGPRKVGGVQASPGDLLLVAASATANCEMFEVRTDPGTGGILNVVDPTIGRGSWNAGSYPAGSYGDGNFVIDMGQPLDITYSIVNNALAASTLSIAADGTPSYNGPVEAYPDIVNMQALYGKDTDGNGTVDTWDNTTPTTNAGWLQVQAVRIAIVARSSQYERDAVTADDLQWDLGTKTTATIPVGADCGVDRCLKLKVKHLANWDHYRYRVFETVIPLRNMLWNS